MCITFFLKKDYDKGLRLCKSIFKTFNIFYKKPIISSCIIVQCEQCRREELFIIFPWSFLRTYSLRRCSISVSEFGPVLNDFFSMFRNSWKANFSEFTITQFWIKYVANTPVDPKDKTDVRKTFSLLER